MSSVPEFIPQGQVLVRVPEPLTLVNIPQFVAAVEDALVWCPWLVLDLVDVRHVDELGADTLVWACREARRRCGDAYLVGVSSTVREGPEWSRLAGIVSESRLESLPARPPRETWTRLSTRAGDAVPH